MIKYNLLGEMEASYVLCEGRHDDAPTTDAIFPNTIPIMAFGKLDLDAFNKLKPLADKGLKRLVIYTSGCQSALVAAINAASKLRIREVVVMHHDNALHGWQGQQVVTLNNIVK